MRTRLIAAVSAALAAVPATAATSFTTNFDSIAVGSAGYTDVGAIEGWSAGPGGVRVNATGPGGVADTGTNFVELDTGTNGFIEQAVEAGSYVLSFVYAARPRTDASTNGVGLYLGGALLGIFNDNAATTDDTNWVRVALNFNAPTASTLRFEAFGTPDAQGTFLDSVSLADAAPPVPEPGEWAMIAAGLAVVGFVARRRGARFRALRPA